MVQEGIAVGDLTKDFSRSEFACKCGCGFDQIDPRVVDMCQMIRDALGAPIRINSACRCERRNAEAHGVKGSYHTKGLAADLSCEAGSQRLQAVIKSLFEAGKLPCLEYCKRYVQKNFVHIDCGHQRKNRFAKE